MTAIRRIALVVILFQSCVVSLAAAEDQKTCFYLDNNKVHHKDYYDALIRIEKISSIEAKFRNYQR